jgi:hypothetical protein
MSGRGYSLGRLHDKSLVTHCTAAFLAKTFVWETRCTFHQSRNRLGQKVYHFYIQIQDALLPNIFSVRTHRAYSDSFHGSGWAMDI